MAEFETIHTEAQNVITGWAKLEDEKEKADTQKLAVTVTDVLASIDQLGVFDSFVYGMSVSGHQDEKR